MGQRSSAPEKERKFDCLPNVFTETLPETLSLYYREKIQPLERHLSYHLYGSLPLYHAEFGSPPMIVFMGEASVGKTTIVNHLISMDYAGSSIGPEPTTESFYILMYGPENCQFPATSVTNDDTFPYQGLKFFGRSLLMKCFIVTCPSPILKHITIVDTPGILSGELQTKRRPFKYDLVMHYLAEKADIVFLVVDTVRLDLSDEVKQALSVLKSFEEKLTMILNKADSCNIIALEHVRGGLAWSLSRQMKGNIVPRMYTCSLWDRPLRCPDHREQLERDMREISKRVRALTYMVHERRLKDLARRASQLRVFAIIANELNSKYSRVRWKKLKRRDARRLFKRIYPKLVTRHQLGKSDLPSTSAMHRILMVGLKNILPPVKKSLLSPVESFLTYDVPLFKAALPTEPPKNVNLGRLEEPVIYQNTEQFDWCTVAEEAVKRGWRREFKIFCKGDEQLSYQRAELAFKLSNMNRAVWDTVWNMVDHNKDGILNEREFYLMMFLLKRIRDGHRLPSSLSDCMKPPKSESCTCGNELPVQKPLAINFSLVPSRDPYALEQREPCSSCRRSRKR
uniref:EH domain-containing protein n=1 Tax=Trichuris muris TaxID=70415 RepID=A0A5S6QAZ7_TRIMR